MTFSRVFIFCSAAAILVSCSDKPRPAAGLAEAYVGPATLNLRTELSLKSPIASTVKHGEKLYILESKHRLVKVRSEKGAEGWTDMRQLLSPEQMDALRDMASNASRDISQGQATVFEALNMHTEPNRASPSFGQIPENSKVDVIGHKLMPRVQKDEVLFEVPTKAAPIRRKSKSSTSTRIKPPKPPAPKLPDNWVALSVPRLPQPPPPPAPPPAPVPMDDWSLVRTKDGKVGWVLTRPLAMAIPDEVAQYAEGHRITSYFPLGQVNDDGTIKNNWLWTTITKGGQPYEFDSFRVFVWSLRHHRYETAYIERNVTGHYPVQVNTATGDPSFSVILEGNDGHLYRETYTFDSYRVHMTNKEMYDPDAKPEHPNLASNQPASEPGEAKRSWYAQLKDRVHHLWR